MSYLSDLEREEWISRLAEIGFNREVAEHDDDYLLASTMAAKFPDDTSVQEKWAVINVKRKCFEFYSRWEPTTFFFFHCHVKVMDRAKIIRPMAEQSN